jgi:hypothetical protein
MSGRREVIVFSPPAIFRVGGEPSGADEGAVAPGGIVRVLRKGADKAVADLSDDSHRETLWRLLLRMVNLVGTRTGLGCGPHLSAYP